MVLLPLIIRTLSNYAILPSNKCLDILILNLSNQKIELLIPNITFLNNSNKEIIDNKTEFTGYRKDGSSFPLEIEGRETFVDHNIKFIFLLHDITERKESEKITQRLVTILENYWNEVAIVDARTLQYIYANESLIDNTGYSLNEIINSNAKEVNPEFSQEYIEKHIELLYKNKKKSLTLETIRKRKDGSTYPVEMNIQYFQEEDPPVFISISRDITERKNFENLEQRLGKILDNIWTEVYIVETNSFKTVYANKIAQTNLGYTLDEFKNMTPSDFDPNRTIAELQNLINIPVQKTNVQQVFESLHRRKDGSIYPVEVRTQIIDT